MMRLVRNYKDILMKKTYYIILIAMCVMNVGIAAINSNLSAVGGWFVAALLIGSHYQKFN